MLRPGTPRRQRGFTLVEALVTMTVLALLMAAGAPSLGGWIANGKVRSVAEALANDLRQAQSESLTRNRQVVFALTNASPALDAVAVANGTRWFAQTQPIVATETLIEAEDFIHGSTQAFQADVQIAGPAATCFNSVGRPVARATTTVTAACVAPASTTVPISYTVSRAGADRSLTVQVHVGGRIRLCDNSTPLTAARPDGCTP